MTIEKRKMGNNNSFQDILRSMDVSLSDKTLAVRDHFHNMLASLTLITRTDIFDLATKPSE